MYVISGGANRYEAIAGSGGVTAGTFVKWSSNTIVAATDGTGIAGMALNTAVAGAQVTVVAYPAVVRTTAASGVNFAPGDSAYIATTTTVDAGSQGNTPCGIVVNTDPATAGAVDLLIQTSDLTITAHA